MRWSVEDIVRVAREPVTVQGNTRATFTKTLPLDLADADCVVWVNPRKPAALELLAQSPASVVICAESVVLSPELLRSKAFVLTENPKLVFSRLVRALFVPAEEATGVSPQALVSAHARIHETAVVGPFTVIERAELGRDVRVDSHCQLYDGVVLGERVRLRSHTVLGVEGFGYTQAPAGQWEQMPHIGRVVLEDDVTLGAHTCVVRGTLGDTVVGAGTKIDNYVTVGHNVRVGRNVLIGSHAVLCGSVVVEDGVWISPQASILNGVRIGAGATIGIGALVVADVAPGAKVVAKPSRVLTGMLARMRGPLA